MNLSFNLSGECEDEIYPLARVGFGPDGPAVLFDDLFCDEETQPGAPVSLHIVAKPHKPLKKECDLIGRQSPAFIPDLKLIPRLFLFEADFYLSVFPSIF